MEVFYLGNFGFVYSSETYMAKEKGQLIKSFFINATKL